LYTGETESKIKNVADIGYNGREFCCLDVGEYDRAISDFEELIELNTPWW